MAFATDRVETEELTVLVLCPEPESQRTLKMLLPLGLVWPCIPAIFRQKGRQQHRIHEATSTCCSSLDSIYSSVLQARVSECYCVAWVVFWLLSSRHDTTGLAQKLKCFSVQKNSIDLLRIL